MKGCSRRDVLRIGGVVGFSIFVKDVWGVQQVVRAPEPTGVDSTRILQKAIDSLGVGETIDGMGREYVVTRLTLKSDVTFRNFRLRARGTATPLDSVLTIDGNKSVARNIVIRDVHIDGNRNAQTNLFSEEDGGRDGIRIVGHAERLLINNCSAVNCATDGLKLFSHQSLSRNDAVLNFRDIYVTNCRFVGNRRHGASGDSLADVYFVDCEFSGNGVDVPGTRSEGSRGALDQGMIYGAGIDIEGYGAGSGVNGLYFVRCQAYRNARFGIQFWEPTSPKTQGFIPRRGIVLESCSVDGGVSPRHGHQAVEFSQPAAIRSAMPTYEDIRIVGLKCNGTVILNGVHHAFFAGGQIRSPYPGFWGVGEFCRNINFIGVDSESKIFALKS